MPISTADLTALHPDDDDDRIYDDFVINGALTPELMDRLNGDHWEPDESVDEEHE